MKLNSALIHYIEPNHATTNDIGDDIEKIQIKWDHIDDISFI